MRALVSEINRDHEGLFVNNNDKGTAITFASRRSTKPTLKNVFFRYVAIRGDVTRDILRGWMRSWALLVYGCRCNNLSY